jgi:hypothetical protein
MESYILVFCILIPFASAIEITNSTDDNVTVSCSQEHDYDSLDLREVSGKWKVLELYMHLTKEGVVPYKSCPTTTIWEVDDFPRSTYGVRNIFIS